MRSILIILLMLALTGGCGDGDRKQLLEKKEAERKARISPEEAACHERVTRKGLELAVENLKKPISFSIENTLAERRINEAFCLESVKCYGSSDEKFNGIQLSICLNHREKS